MRVPIKGYGIATVTLLAVLCGCKSSDSGIDPGELPDLNAQVRPYVTIEDTRVRTGPGPQFRSIAEIRRDSRVQVVGRDGDYVLIVSKKGNAPGFIELAAIQPATGEETAAPPRIRGRYETLADTQVRSGPGHHHPVVAEISKGTKINVVDEEQGWLKVESKRGNKPGYVDGSLAKPAPNS